MSLNLKRRHLDESQRAVVGLKLEPLFAAEAKERMLAGKADPKAGLPQGQARDEAAALVNVSGRLIQDAKTVARQAPEMLPAIESGSKTVTQAVREIKEPNRQAKRDSDSERI